uniref:DUF998 domain-containing protein n=1 Tax=Microbispora cellulosiformans TaxID=2614688 RepID=UPI00384B3E99
MPPEPPDLPQPNSRQGLLHDLFSLAGFVALAAACVVFAWSGTPGWAIYRPVGQCSGVHAGGEGPRGSAHQGASVPWPSAREQVGSWVKPWRERRSM